MKVETSNVLDYGPPARVPNDTGAVIHAKKSPFDMMKGISQQLNQRASSSQRYSKQASASL